MLLFVKEPPHLASAKIGNLCLDHHKNNCLLVYRYLLLGALAFSFFI